jgi:hypothetical protein
VAELQRRGAYRTSCEPGTLRRRLFGQGDRLPDNHPGARYRGAVISGAGAPRISGAALLGQQLAGAGPAARSRMIVLTISA